MLPSVVALYCHNPHSHPLHSPLDQGDHKARMSFKILSRPASKMAAGGVKLTHSPVKLVKIIKKKKSKASENHPKDKQ